MNHDLGTIQKVKDFFESLGVKAEDIFLEINNLKNEEHVLRRYLKKINEEGDGYKKELKHIKKHTYDDQSAFSIGYETKELLTALEDIFQNYISFSETFNTFYIKSSQSELFLETWSLFKNKVNWQGLSGNKNFHWTYENIDKGIKMNIWDWTELSKNPAVPWNFDFVERYKNLLEWKYVKVNKNLEWDEESISKYAHYIFNSKTIEDKYELNFGSDLIDIERKEFELNKNIAWTNSLITTYQDKWNWDILSTNPDIIFDDFLVNNHSDKLNFKYVSRLKNINISTTTIEKFKDFWDWESLVANTSIKLDFSTIFLQKNKIDWNFVMIQPHLVWSKDLFENYAEEIFKANLEVKNKKLPTHKLDIFCKKINHTGYFESNQNFEWNDIIIDKYKDQLNWEMLCQNTTIKFTEEQLYKYENYINWSIFFKYGNTDWNESIISRFLHKSNISNLFGNVFLFWDLSMFQNFIENQDKNIISNFCSNAKIAPDIIIKYQKLWATIEIAVSHNFKFSDWAPYSEYTYHTLWEDLFTNIFVVWDDNLLESCINNIVINEINYSSRLKLSVNFINKYWEFFKEENVWYSGNYNKGTYREKSDVYLRKHFKYCEISDLDLNKFIENELKWLNSSLNDSSLNKSVEKLILNECEKRNIC